ncbi:MAG: DeoR/GlpR transcriptional regulator [Ruminococcaceae bacterium]|nr:DeoR/GlpR transcriptional regulator [Oscillospiraceae bacterium]
MKDRRQSIYDLIEQHGEISIHELEALFPDVSSMTIRRDLDFLETDNKIVKIKGGAKSLSHLSRTLFHDVEGDYVQREIINSAGKRRIAEKAIPFAETGRSIFIDAGSTMMQLARRLKTGRFSVITNAINVALELSQNLSASVNLVGGELNRRNLCVSGAGALEHVRHINIDIAFIAASGYSIEDGFTNGSFDEYELKRFIIQKAKKTIILMDTSKVGKSMPYTFCTPEDVDILIMDEVPERSLLSAAKTAGMKIL